MLGAHSAKGCNTMNNWGTYNRAPEAVWLKELSLIRLLAVALAVAVVATVLGTAPRANADTPGGGSLDPAVGAQQVGATESRELAQIADLPSSTEDGHEVALNEAQAWKLADGGWFVSAPATGDGIYMATVSATLTPEKKVIQSGEAVFTGDAKGGHATIWVDGEKVVDDEFANTPENDQVIIPMINWGKLNDCLSSAGIPSWVIAALSAGCGVACGATAGAGCVACMVGLGLVGGATIGYCLEEAQ